MDDPVLYVVSCGSPAADGLPEFVRQTKRDGWRPCVVTTPMGSRFFDLEELEQLTGYPVRSVYKNPDDPDVLPLANAVVVAPATFNTVNKIANGITDTLATGLICEYIGLGVPVLVVPSVNEALANHGAFRRSLGYLADGGVHLILNKITNLEPRSASTLDVEFPWELTMRTLNALRDKT